MGDTLAVVRSVQEIHRQLLSSIFHLPMYFYDTTPIGRVLQLFSSDFDTVEDDLPESFIGIIWLVIEVILYHQFLC